jgi:hypothetical protein
MADEAGVIGQVFAIGKPEGITFHVRPLRKSTYNFVTLLFYSTFRNRGYNPLILS